jgi:uncharacterized protein (DUF1015 family)
MASVFPFRALRPAPEAAARVAAVPYDVVSTDEARALAASNPLSFLHVSRSEIDLPPGTDPYSDQVYHAAAERFTTLKRTAPLVVEDAPSLYLYRLTMGTHQQVGVAACYSLDEYDRDLIKKHERTRRDKEDDRTRHMIALGAQTGPVFLTYRARTAIDQEVARLLSAPPLLDFVADDGVRHTIWRVSGADAQMIVRAFADVPALYIADGHHRAASAARTREQVKSAEANTVLAVAFPHDQTQILPYNRVVKDLSGHAPADFIAEISKRFTVKAGGGIPSRKGEVGMYLAGKWQTLVLDGRGQSGDAIDSLDVSVLQNGLLDPVLKIVDIRTDKRIDFVGGIRGAAELERQVNEGRAAVAFSLFPVSVDDLMRVADQGGIMPPKSTWFEPKLRDGLLSHVL